MKLPGLGFTDAAGFANLRKRQSARMGVDPTSDGDFKRTADEDGDFGKKDEDLLGKPITSPPDGGSDFKKGEGEEDADKDKDKDKGESDGDKGKEDPKPKDGDDKPKKPKSDDEDRQVPISDEPVEIAIVYPIPEGEDGEADDTTSEPDEGEGSAEENLKPATEDLIGRLQSFFSSSRAAPKAEKGLEGLKKYLETVPRIVGPVDDKVTSEKKANVIDYKACIGLIGDIRGATAAYSQFVKQLLRLDVNRDYEIGQATSFVVRQINAINSPMLALFSAYSPQHKFHGIGEHKLKAPATSTAPLGEHGWTDTLAVKTCDALRVSLESFISEVESGTAACEKRAKEMQGKFKESDSKKLDDAAKERLQNLAGTWHLMVSGMDYSELLVRRAAEVVNHTVHQLAGIYPTKGGADDKHKTD